MLDTEIYEELKSICKQLDIKIIYEANGQQKGFALVNGRKHIVINKFYSLEQKIKSLSDAMKNTDLDGIFIKPAIRSYIYDISIGF
ncbi:hypothetical protein OAQ99_05315 [Candidatus Kapabacteria bacterium]|nr:hypothetical protein [Candidatus Kapabacteria bacterium]